MPLNPTLQDKRGLVLVNADGSFDSDYPLGDKPSSGTTNPPLTTNVRQFIFGHSLINHTGFGEANDLTNILIWMSELAQQAGYTYAMGGQFGQGASHVTSVTDPNTPIAQWGVLGVSGAAAGEVLDDTTWASSNFNTIMFTPANFRQDFPADVVNPSWTDITTQSTATIFDFAEAINPARYIIYENWPDMGGFTSADFVTTFPTSAELTIYWNHAQNVWNDWWTHYQDVMLVDRPNLNIQMIPVAPILGKLLLGTLSTITPQALYEDNAPHGRPTLYFLAGLITYMGTYGTQAPSDYVVPATIDGIVLANYAQIVAEIWTELQNFNYVNGDSRVFPDTARQNLGVNLDGVTDFSTSNVFVDMIKNVRPLVGAAEGNFDTGESIDPDANGWPQTIPVDPAPEIYRYVDLFWTSHPNFIGGRYILTHEGTGSFLYLGGFTFVSETVGRIVVDIASGQFEGGFRIAATTNGNHLRNIKLVREADEFVDTIADPFTPQFLSSLNIYGSFRFMDWPQTNNSTQFLWADRVQVGQVSYADGVPIEVMAKIMNQTNSDGWFCIPHLADDNYVTQMAALLLSELDTARKVLVEYSNETWNPTFQQTAYCLAQGIALWPGEPESDGEKQFNWIGLRTDEVLGLWKTVWSANLSRVTGLMGAQGDNGATATQALDCAIKGGGNCAGNVDAIAIAPYFGNELGAVAREAEVELLTVTQIFAELDTTWVPTVLTDIDAMVTIADTYGLGIVGYEGGQHLTASEYSPENVTITNLFIDVNRDPRMEATYDTYFNGWKARTSGVFMQFAHSGTYSKFGSWGSVEHLAQISIEPHTPKRLSLEKF